MNQLQTTGLNHIPRGMRKPHPYLSLQEFLRHGYIQLIAFLITSGSNFMLLLNYCSTWIVLPSSTYCLVLYYRFNTQFLFLNFHCIYAYSCIYSFIHIYSQKICIYIYTHTRVTELIGQFLRNYKTKITFMSRISILTPLA